MTHRPQSPPPQPTLTLNYSYCKLNIKPIILCIWVLVLARRTGSAARPHLGWHTLPSCCPCLTLGRQRPSTTRRGRWETITRHAQKCNVRTHVSLQKNTLVYLISFATSTHTLHSVYSEDIVIYGRRCNAATKIWTPHTGKKLLGGKTPGSSDAVDGSRGSCVTKGWSSAGSEERGGDVGSLTFAEWAPQRLLSARLMQVRGYSWTHELWAAPRTFALWKVSFVCFQTVRLTRFDSLLCNFIF